MADAAGIGAVARGDDRRPPGADARLTAFEKSFQFGAPTAKPPESPMFEADLTPAEQIERLEAQIDELREAIRRSRRLVVAGRLCAFAGAALLAALILGMAFFSPIRMIVGISLGLGGLVLMGSSVGSTKQFELSLK